MSHLRRLRSSPDVRAQSEALGVVLVFSMVIAAASIVVVFGVAAVGDSEQQLSTDRAEKALTQLDSRAALVALENTDIQQVQFAATSGGRFRVQNGTGWMNVSVVNTTAGGGPDPVVNQSLGDVTFDNGADTIAYQGGGVWKASGDGSVMVSPPEFHYRNGTLTLPVINVTGDPSLNGGAGLSHLETVRQFPVTGATDRTNPLDQHRVFVAVQSDHYQAWGRYFQQRTDGEVRYDHDANKAILELVSPIGRQKITSAAASYAASGTFELHGSAKVSCGSTIYTNSYNSSETTDDYCDQAATGGLGDDGDLVYGADVDIDTGTGSSNIRGDVVSGGTVTVSGSGGGGQPDVHGNISYTDACAPSVADCEDRIIKPTGEAREINGVETMNHVDRMVEKNVDELQSDNDNGPADVSGDTLDFSSSSPTDEVTLTAGKYYLEDVTIPGGNTLVLDTTGGTVTLGVRGGIDLGDGASIQVQGNGAVEASVLGDDSVHGRSVDVRMDKNAGVLAPDDNATQFRMYGPSDLQVQVGAGNNNLAKYVGVVFAPPGVAGTSRVDVDGGEVYGGVITGTTAIDSGSIHYDEALAQKQIISRGEKVVKVTYLHVTTNRIYVGDG